MKTIEAIYGIEKTANPVATLVRGGKGIMSLIGQKFTKPVVDKAVDFGSRASKKFMEGGLGEKFTIALGGTTAAYTGLKGIDAITGAKTSRILPKKGIIKDLSDPFNESMPAFQFSDRAKRLSRSANLQPAYRRAQTPRNIRG